MAGFRPSVFLWSRSKFFAEFIGTAGIVFFGCGSLMIAERFPGALEPGAVPLIFGLTVASMVYTLGHISGAHFNPAVTLGFAVSRHFNWRELPSYWIAQFGGAITAIFLLRFILPIGELYGATIPHVDLVSAVIWETILTFFLMFVISSVATDFRAVGIMAGAAIGAIVCLGAFVGGAATGASMNPARSFAPALFQGMADNFFMIYFASPLMGAAIGALTYEKIRCSKKHDSIVKDEQKLEKKKAGGCC